MITNDTTQRTCLAIYLDQVIQNEYDLPHGTCLGARCCDWCGRPMGLVRQKDGTYKQRCFCGG